jgi:hypothetical protein
MDWNAVAELATQYESAGLGNTRSGSFLKSVAQSQMARGGGASWLDTLMENGDPRPWVKLANEIQPLMAQAGTEERYLKGILSRLSEGRKARDWELEILERVKARASHTTAPLTDRQVSILNSVDGVIHNGKHYYWSRRAGFHDKAMRIVSMAKNTSTIHPNDWSWIEENFKGVIRAIDTSAGEDGQIRFWYSPTGWKTVMVMGNGYYHRDVGGMVQDCLFEGQIKPIRIDKLKKRLPKEV